MITKTDNRGKNFIKSFESCSLVPYLCSSGVPTIGWGNTIYPNGKKVTMRDKPISQEFADSMFLFILSLFEKDVLSLLKQPVTQNQFNGLVSFAYNLGSDIDADDIAEGLGDSTLLKKVNKDPNDITIKDEFLKWNKSNGKVSNGLVRRRKGEGIMYFTK